MKLLVDTHAFLWLVEGSPNLSAKAQAALADPAHELHLSVASVWELAIKTGKKKLTLVGLPDHHQDPFDRILIAQALVEGMTLVSADAKFTPYSVPILW